MSYVILFSPLSTTSTKNCNFFRHFYFHSKQIFLPELKGKGVYDLFFKMSLNSVWKLLQGGGGGEGETWIQWEKSRSHHLEMVEWKEFKKVCSLL